MPGNVCFRADATGGQHPGLESRKRLSALLRAARSLHLPEATPEERDLVDDLLRAAEKAARNLGPLKDCDTRLDAFLRDMADEVDSQYRTQERLPAAVNIRKLVNRLREDALSVSCESCVGHGAAKPGAAEKVCRDDSRIDGQNMRNGAACWAPFQGLLQFALLVAQEAYDAVLPQDCQIDLAVEFHTCGTRESALGARTKFPATDRPGARRAIVEVTLPEDHFNFEHFAALLYLIFHEVCVHGPQAWSTAGKRAGTLEDCPFREGFVDAAAAELLEEALHVRMAALAPDLLPFAEDIALKTKAEHNRRRDVTPEEASPDARKTAAIRRVRQQRARGVKLFERLKKREAAGASRLTGHLAVRLALCANVLDVPDAALVELIERLERVTDPKLPYSPVKQGYYRRLRSLVIAPSPALDEIRSLLSRSVDNREF
ncbi:hypothetical protein E0493_18465 [Roseomonas sp. M0104]|uniref:Uncharacterized protein n=1 Tax=Teichococcus coralli TaxID=2545983 RepID=A0A845BEG0_9PROT|nr:hypothetical protein [Pseudoroseomonas coralli]MXP65335.1 hypothetical protein [Pseudoroseomonas coralli]